MRVTIVTATLRYSAETKGAWRSIEVGAEATLTNSDEPWETAQQELYHRLGQQLKALWINGNGKAEAQEQPTSGNQAHKQSHWCDKHSTEFKKRNGKNGVFYSHKVTDGGWCNEK
ncbi:MAG TPA: hypothetical protein VFA32_16760 [Dehalococcoidia bacterium]|jgi:hypothetical protein|nr:hypothetical protein [Dehalococcoidia bacterium]